MESQANKIISFYDKSAKDLAKQYDGLKTVDIYGSAIAEFPTKASFVLDVAAGSGRDAAWLAGKGHFVTAVEPATGMFNKAKQKTQSLGVRWVQDRLPTLSKVARPSDGFDFILAAAVWMHLTPEERVQAYRTLARLTADGGKVLITLRHGTSDDRRPMLPIDSKSEIELAYDAGFRQADIIDGVAKDQLNRDEVSWEILRLVL